MIMDETKADLKEYKTATFWKKYGDIVFFKYAPALDMDVHVAREMVASRLEYTKGEAVYALIDVTNLKSTTKEARDYMNSPEGGLRGIKAGAFLSNNVVPTLLINLYLKVSNPPVPAKFFTSEEEALKWLIKIKEKSTSSVH